MNTILSSNAIDLHLLYLNMYTTNVFYFIFKATCIQEYSTKFWLLTLWSTKHKSTKWPLVLADCIWNRNFNCHCFQFTTKNPIKNVNSEACVSNTTQKKLNKWALPLHPTDYTQILRRHHPPSPKVLWYVMRSMASDCQHSLLTCPPETDELWL